MIEQLLRKMGKFKGKQRIARWLLRKKMKYSRDVLVEGQFGCKYLLPNISENIGFEIFIDGVYEENHLNLIIDRLPLNSTFIDIGANIGTIAIPVAKLRPDVQVVGVEAASRMFAYLNRNVELNELSGLKLYHKAMSDVNDAEVHFYSPDLKYGKGSMSSVFTDQAEVVKTISLDKLVSELPMQPIGMIKVDVEGFECSVFKGGQQLLSSDEAPDILFEYVDWAESSSGLYQAGDAQAFLISMGYQLFLVENEKMIPVDEPMTSGFAMIFASKKRNQ